MGPASGDVQRHPVIPEAGAGAGGEPPGPRPRRRRPQLVVLVALGCGGVVGAVSRYAVSLALPTGTGGFPWGTFAVNVSGSALLGLVLVLLIERFPLGRLARPVIGTGVIGAYTTFSTYVVEAVLLVRAGRAPTAVAYVAFSVLAGLLAVWFGMTTARTCLLLERRHQERIR